MFTQTMLAALHPFPLEGEERERGGACVCPCLPFRHKSFPSPAKRVRAREGARSP
jgi:hypothetical protein